MRLMSIHLRNFRLLRRLSFDLAAGKTTTVLVGPNNSGKTSVMDALRLFVGTGPDIPKITFHDISQVRQRDFKIIEKRLEATKNQEDKIALLRRFAPRMRLDLTFMYDEDAADLAAATALLMDLDPESNRVRLRIEYAIDNAAKLLSDFEARSRKADGLCEFLHVKYRDYFKRFYYKVTPDGRAAQQLEDGGILKRLLKIDVVAAQRHVDDEESDRSAKLSKLLHNHYTRFYRVDDAAGYQAVEEALLSSAADLTEKYSAAFGRLTKRLRKFGYPQGQSAPDLRIRAQMSSETLYRDNTRIYYASKYAGKQGIEEFELPEKYNGLGYKNLIYIVVELESFRAALEAMEGDRPRVHVIGIEEPEAHLHPQMQSVFINEISKALEADGGTTAHVILSTHSSHIIANSAFEPIRYFRRSGRHVHVRDLSKLPLPSEGAGVMDFLRRYIQFTHFDLFFADKAIFVEGQVERLLLPLMIEACAQVEGCEGFTSQYISISEVGGAYAHKFKPLIDFLGIPTLIVTDLDSVDNEGKKCPVIAGERTSNACLKTWLPGKETIADLAACDAVAKSQGCIRVAYQTAEAGYCGRSFEEAFIYANLEWLEKNYTALPATSDVIKPAVDAGLASQAWDLSAKLGKVDFALDLIAKTGWKTPAYIQEGLVWLACERPGYDRS
jgi:putative ATP-dependent endonuclease of OLD family